jgi:tetratricopeptide (TPR) repeat protein
MLARILLALFALLHCAGIAYAGDKVLYQPAPGWIVPPPSSDFAKLTDADPALVLHDVQTRIDGNRVWTHFDRAVRVVSPQMMNEVGTVTLTWHPDQGDIIVHRLEILRGGERIDVLAKGQMFEVLRREQQLEQMQVNGTLTATMAVDALRVGDVLRVSYSTTSRDTALGPNAQALLGLLSEPARAGFARVRLSWPAATPLGWRLLSGGTPPAVKREGEFQTIEVTMPLSKPAELPEGAPVRFRKLPMLEVSTFSGWDGVSRVMAPLYETTGLIAPGSPLMAEVEKIRAKSADPKMRVALAVRLVQDEVRYLFNGMDGGNYLPQSPADTWARRYGDCKAKSLLLLSILHALGIEAEAMLVHITLGDLVPSRLPSAAAFDHVIVHATIDGRPFWLDGTGSGVRLEDLGDAVHFRNGLPLRADGAALISLPMYAPARPQMTVSLDYDQRAGLYFPAPYTFTMTLRGPMAETMRGVSTQADEETINEMARGMVTSAIGDAVVTDSSLTYDDASAIVTFTARGIRTSLWESERGRMRADFDMTLTKTNLTADRARPAWKDIPVVVAPFPFSSRVTVRVQLPLQGAGFSLEGSQTIPPLLAGVRVSRLTTLAGGALTIDDTLAFDGREIAASDLPEVRATVTQYASRPLVVLAPEDYPQRWKVYRDARQNNALAPIMAVYDRAIEKDPKNNLGYSNRATFLSGVRDNKAAIKDLDRLIALEPNADNYLWRASLRESTGDQKGARADAEAALALDPGSASAIGKVATYRFRDGEREAAITVLRERMDLKGEEEAVYGTQLASLLVEAGRGEEAIAILDELIRTKPGNPTLLNERCWTKGTANLALDTGLRDCTRGIELAENPAHILDSRAMIYFRMGRFEEALEDLDAALDIAPTMAAALYLRGIVHLRMGKQAEGNADLEAARFLSQDIDAKYARWGIKP